jgi:proline iminopeptidase
MEVAKKYKPDFSDGISNFNVPVLFFYAEKNKAYPDSWAQKISGVFCIATPELRILHLPEAAVLT